MQVKRILLLLTKLRITRAWKKRKNEKKHLGVDGREKDVLYNRLEDRVELSGGSN